MDRRITEKKIRKVVNAIADKYRPEKIILFGSWAWGEPGQDSDVDFFIIKDVENTRAEARDIDGFIFPRPFPLDIIVYKSDQVARAAEIDFFVRNIITKGKVLYDAKSLAK